MATVTHSPVSMDIESNGSETVVRFRGKLDSSLSPAERQRIIALLTPGCQFALDMSNVTDVSAVGMRMLLLLARAIRAVDGTIAGVGVPDKLKDLAESAGFAKLFAGATTAVANSNLHASPVQIDAYATHSHNGFALRAGSPLPFGAAVVSGGLNFSVFSRHATECTLVLYEPGEREPFAEILFPPEFRIGDVFAMTVFGLDAESVEYGFRMNGPYDPERGHRFDPSRVLLDPLARSIAGQGVWGSTRSNSYHGRIVPADFDWEGDRPLDLPMEDLVIYELHVRGFTRHPSSSVKHPGTFAGLREKIPYLKDLGVNCVELLPIFEFDETENPRLHLRTGEPLLNYWGYSTLAFHAPKASYAATGSVGMQADELKFLIKELHRSGIEVMLDVVFNHTAEGDERGPTISFRGIDNRTYYMLTPDGHYYNFSGCGNTFNCNHPAVRGFVIECLRDWVAEYHIDGFRFDLATILGRGQHGEPLANPPLLEALAGDPVLGRTKLVAEAWDAGGLYQVGSFPGYGRWAEWNGRYRDCVRKFLKGDAGQVSEMATRMMGSSDLYHGRVAASVNFITCHDGFTLADLVSYNEKHNADNGEENRDGANDNYSWNCGAEGPTDDAAINELRLKQTKNALALLLLSRGIPMLLMGDECGRSQQGNNNAYCHDGPLTWLDWDLAQRNHELIRFTRLLIEFRRRHAALSAPVGAMDVSWHGARAWQADWSAESRLLAWLRTSAKSGLVESVYFAANMHWEPHVLELPSPQAGQSWHVVANTALPSPEDICEPDEEPRLPCQTHASIAPRSIMVLLAN